MGFLTWVCRAVGVRLVMLTCGSGFGLVGSFGGEQPPRSWVRRSWRPASGRRFPKRLPTPSRASISSRIDPPLSAASGFLRYTGSAVWLVGFVLGWFGFGITPTRTLGSGTDSKSRPKAGPVGRLGGDRA